jgi:anti-sigma B factor antagonist
MPRFGIGIEWAGDAVHLHVHGELDIAVAAQLVERVEAVRESSARLALLDLHEVTFMDSSGLRGLIQAQQLGDEDFEVIAIRSPAPVRDVIGITGAHRVLRLADDAAAALRQTAG